MRRLTTRIAVVIVVACRSRQLPEAVTTHDVAIVDTTFGGMAPALRGNWMGGSGPEPAERVIFSQAQCRYHPPAWVLDASGDSVFSYHFPASYEQGVARREPPVRTLPAVGRVRRDTIFLNDGSDRYVVQYDSVSGHLRGTRNGQPFWAVRTEEQNRERCPAVP